MGQRGEIEAVRQGAGGDAPETWTEVPTFTVPTKAKVTIRMDRDMLAGKFNEALPYGKFVALGDPEGHRPPWEQRYSQLHLTSGQNDLVKSFTRKMHVLCLTGTWCGDCALQGSAMQRIAEANPENIDLRFLLRSDAHAPLIVKARIN